jgi:chemotaxis protein histidine kinase CheA
MLTDGKYSQTMSAEQIRGALDALNQTTNLLQEHSDMITLAVDNDEAGQNFVKGLQDDGIPVIPDLPPRQPAQKKMDWNDYLKQMKKESAQMAETPEVEKQSLSELQESLSNEGDLVSTITSDSSIIYTNTVSFNQDYNLNLEIHSPNEVDNLSDIQAPWTLEVMKKGQSLGYLAYGEDWGNDFDIEDELVNLENWVKDNQVTNHLYTQKDINAFLASTQEVEPKMGDFVLKGGGIYDFGKSQLEGEELRQHAIDAMISDITDAETYYLWHDEELEKLNAPDEAFLNFHYHLQDIQYNQNDIHLYVSESSTDGVTGYLSLDGNSLDSDSIEEYLADQDWTFNQKVQFLKNLKTAVDDTWNKVTDHYNEQFNAIVDQYGLSLQKEKTPEVPQEQESANSEQQKKVENPIGDLPEQSQEAAPLPNTHEEYSLNESSPTQTQSQPLLHFNISNPDKSIYKVGYHPVNRKELNKLNRYAAQIQENATWYKNELADSNVTYFYKNNDNLEALKVTFKAEQYPHLIGFFAIDENQSASKTLDDLASGKGDYQNIMVANRGATFSKIQVLPDFKAVVDSNSFIFDDLSEVERMNRLDLAKAIRTEDKDVLIAFRNVDGEYLPASLMKVTNKLESELSIANNKDVLGIVGEKIGVFKVL